MTQPNLSNSTSDTSTSDTSTSGTGHSAFQSAQSALARKPLPGPQWAWPGVAALAIAAVAYLVAGTSGEHAGHRAAPSAEGAPSEAVNPTTTTAALEPATAAPAAAPAPSEPPAAPAAAPVADAPASPPKAEAEPAKAKDDAEQAVASAPAVTKKKGRRAAHRGSRKRSAAAQ